MIDKYNREIYIDISSELLAAQIAYFEDQIFQTTDCSLLDSFEGDGVVSGELESRNCYTVFYVQETQHWTVGGGFATYQYSTYSYSSEYKCDNIMDPGMYIG